MSVVARRATRADAIYLATRLLPEDAAEVKAASGLAIVDALLGGIELSDECLVLCNRKALDKPICIWGIRSTPDPDVGAIWLLCAKGLQQNRVGFLKESLKWFAKFSQQYRVLWNLVDERNTAHVRFLQWHGCVFINRHAAFGHERRPFLEFVRLSCVTPSASP
jgi:hypothetical protein